MSSKQGKKYEEFFEIAKSGESAKCLKCYDVLKLSQRSRKGLSVHLKTKHKIDLNALPISSQAASTLSDIPTL